MLIKLVAVTFVSVAIAVSIVAGQEDKEDCIRLIQTNIGEYADDLERISEEFLAPMDMDLPAAITFRDNIRDVVAQYRALSTTNSLDTLGQSLRDLMARRDRVITEYIRPTSDSMVSFLGEVYLQMVAELNAKPLYNFDLSFCDVPSTN